MCPVTRELVQYDIDSPIGAEIRSVLSIDGDGFVSINESNFDGNEIKARVKGLTPFNVPVYKDIIITNRCAS